MATWLEMIPLIDIDLTRRRCGLTMLVLAALCAPLGGARLAVANTATTPAARAAGNSPLLSLPIPLHSHDCLPDGDGYFRAQLADAINTRIDWPNRGTRCEGESRDKPPGVRMSFERVPGGDSNLLFVFGISGVHEGASARAAGVNVTVIVQGTSRIYGTLGDSRCTIDSLSQRPLKKARSFRVEARGFCTQPAHAVRGKDALLVTTFEFAGRVLY